MNIPRQYESKNFIVRMSVESKNVTANSVMSDNRDSINREIGDMCKNIAEGFEEIHRATWPEEKK